MAEITAHTPAHIRLDGYGYMLAHIEVEVKTGPCGKEVPVIGSIYLVGIKVVAPARAYHGFDSERTHAALISSEEVKEVGSTVETEVLLVKSVAAVDASGPVGGVYRGVVFHAHANNRGKLLA